MAWNIARSTLLPDSLKGWVLALGGLAVILWFDWAVRDIDSILLTAGVSRAIMIIIAIVFGLPALYFFVRPVRGAPTAIMLALLLSQLTILVIALMSIVAVYLCGTGVSCR